MSNKDDFSSSGASWRSHAKDYAADHNLIKRLAAEAIGANEPVAFDPETIAHTIFRKGRRLPPVPIKGVLIRTWGRELRANGGGVQIGVAVFELDGIKIANPRFRYNHDLAGTALEFWVVDAKNYQRLYRALLKHAREIEPFVGPPIMPKPLQERLWRNTIGFLDSANIKMIREYGGRMRRAVILSGNPGNGKTLACRWLWSECRKRNWEWRIVTPDDYMAARRTSQVEKLFSVSKRGIVFFDDMDVALRDRETGSDEDQAIFRTAMDGIKTNEGMVMVFTTNVGTDVIDKAFKRPGRIDVVMRMEPPDDDLRREFIGKWHEHLRNSITIDLAVKLTKGYSFAEITEIRNLMVMHFVDTKQWDFRKALRVFDDNREDFNEELRHRVGFIQPSRNENGLDEAFDGLDAAFGGSGASIPR
jgi:cell division protease FtsH